MDIADVDGYTPLLTAVEANSHQILAVLLDRIRNPSLLRRTRSNATLSHVAIRSADTDTLLTLAIHPLSDLFDASGLNRTDTDNRTVFDIRAQRRGMESALESAANTLLRRGQNRRLPAWPPKVIKTCVEERAGLTAKYLYEPTLFQSCNKLSYHRSRISQLRQYLYKHSK